MASTSLAEQLKKLATPQTNLLVHKKKKASLLFDSSEAASIDRRTFYEIGLSGLNELIEISTTFEEFKYSLFDKNSIYVERAVGTTEENNKLNSTIKKFLHILSPYFLLKSSQKALEWLIARFHIHEYNADELICLTLPYHGTRLFARLLQVFDFKNFLDKWQWLYPLQKKGVPLSKIALFNHCATDLAFLKMLGNVIIEAVEVYEFDNISKLTTLFGFFCTTMVGAIQKMSNITELHLTYILPVLLKGLSSDCIDFSASAIVIISTLLKKTSLHPKIHTNIVDKVTEIKHISLQKSAVLFLNILYQHKDIDRSSISPHALKNIEKNSEWFIPLLSRFLSASIHSNVFYLTLIRDGIRLTNDLSLTDHDYSILIENLLQQCRVDDLSAEKLIKIIIEETKNNSTEWSRKLVQNLEYQYPDPWDNIVTIFFKEKSSAISEILGFTSITSQVKLFEKLNHVHPCVRIEAIKYISENVDAIKVKYLESSLQARWQDSDPDVIEAMFLLPKELRYCSLEVTENLLLQCWHSLDNKWDNLLLKLISSIEIDLNLSKEALKYTILLFPFLVLSKKEIQSCILQLNLPIISIIKEKYTINMNAAINEVLKNFPSNLINDLTDIYDVLPKENVYTLTLMTFLSSAYSFGDCKLKLKILFFVLDSIFPVYFKKFKWKSDIKWNDDSLNIYFEKSKMSNIPHEIVYKFFDSVVKCTSSLEEFTSCSWWDLSNDYLQLVATLYKYLILYSDLRENHSSTEFVLSFITEHFKTLPAQIYFLCNMCAAFKDQLFIITSTFKLMEAILKNTNEKNSWLLNCNAENIVVPCILIFWFSELRELRVQVAEITKILCTSLGTTLSTNVSYVNLLNHLLEYNEEIAVDREQLQSKTYMFLSQDGDIQALLPVLTRCYSRKIHDSLFAHITNEKTPLWVAESVLPIVEYLKDSTVLKILIPFADRLLKQSDNMDSTASFILRSIVDKFNGKEMKIFEQEQTRQFINYCLENSTKITLYTKNNSISCLGAVILRKFSRDIFDKMESNMQRNILDMILNEFVTGRDLDFVNAANSFVKKVTLDCTLLVQYLENMKTVNITPKKSKQKLREDTEKSVDVLNNRDWRIGIVLLELIQNKKKLLNCNTVMPLLFDILKKCCDVDDQLDTEYAKQLCLSCLLNCTNKIDDNKIEKLLHIELIVSCIRTSSSPQTHHHALMLLAYAATFAPNRVLHNVMAIFTFMGSSVLRQEDAFSFQIISDTLSVIIPLVIREKDSEFSISAIATVLRVFAVSLPDIPDHRRIPLLLKLMQILKDGEYMHMLLILILESCTTIAKDDKNIRAKYTDVMQELLSLLPVQVTLNSFDKLITYVNFLPHNLDELSENEKSRKLPPEKSLFDLKRHSNKELCHFKYAALNFMSSVLSSQKFTTKINVTILKSLESHFEKIIEETLLYIKSIMKFNASSKTTSTKYWKVMTTRALEILNKTNALLTNDSFVDIVKSLLNHECITVQRKTMELLNWRLQHPAEEEETINAIKLTFKDLSSIVRSLMKIIETIPNDENTFEVNLNQQTALVSMKLITKHCDTFDHPKKFKKVLLRLSMILANNKDINDHVLACLLLCVAELTSSLKIHAVESLPKFMPTFLRKFRNYHHRKKVQNDVIIASMVSALQKIIETLPNFLSPYLESILYELVLLDAIVMKLDIKEEEDTKDTKNVSIGHRIKLIKQKISADIPSRVLHPSMLNTFIKLCDTKNFNAIKYLLEILTDSFPNNGEFNPELITLCLTMFDFRCTVKEVDDDITLQVEEYVIDAVCKIVLKCSESNFRPFYHKFYDWGVIASKEESRKDRIVTYYRFLQVVSGKLKAIFALFASNFIRNATELLCKSEETESNNMYLESNINKTVLLVDSILKTLHNLFKYDTVRFLTTDRFNMLMEPLVNQIENVIGDYETRSKEIIVPCLSSFAAACTDDSLWKKFMYSILLKTRHSLPEVRLTTLETISTFATLIGDNFLPFLPETVPFLAELMEDENEIVEKRTHNIVRRLEEILGEPIQKYF